MMNGINLLYSRASLTTDICLSNIIREEYMLLQFPKFLYKKKQNLLQIVLLLIDVYWTSMSWFFLRFFTRTLTLLQNIIERLIIVSQWCIKTNIIKGKILYRWFKIHSLLYTCILKKASNLFIIVLCGMPIFNIY